MLHHGHVNDWHPMRDEILQWRRQAASSGNEIVVTAQEAQQALRLILGYGGRWS